MQTRFAKQTTLFAAALVAIMSLTAPAQAFQLKSTDDGAQVRWAKSSIRLHAGSEFRRVFGEDALTALTIAAEAWRGFDRVPDIMIADGDAKPFDPAVRQNGVYWLTEWPYESDHLAMTVTTADAFGRVQGVDVLVNGNQAYALLAEQETGAEPQEVGAGVHDLAAVLTHEMGHVLGLAESEDDPEATMWPVVAPGEVHQRSLSHDDEAGVLEAYAREIELPSSGCVASPRPVRGGGRIALIAPVLLAAAMLFRRRGLHKYENI